MPSGPNANVQLILKVPIGVRLSSTTCARALGRFCVSVSDFEASRKVSNLDDCICVVTNGKNLFPFVIVWGCEEVFRKIPKFSRKSHTANTYKLCGYSACCN